MLSLKHFLLRQQALNLYRSAVRASRAIPEPLTRKETLGWIRVEFERTRYVQDVDIIKDRLASIRRDLKELLPSIRLSLGTS